MPRKDLRHIFLIKSSSHLFILCLFCTSLVAQKFEVGSGVGLLPYKGDFQPSFNPFQPNPGFGLFARYNLPNGVSFQAEGLAGRLSGADSRSNNPLNQQRGGSFSGFVSEGNLQVQVNLFQFRNRRALQKNEFTPYIFAGIGLVSLPKSPSASSLSSQQTVPTSSVAPTSYEFSSPLIPYGIGLKKVWKSGWNLGCNFGARKLIDDDADLLDRFGYKIEDGVKGVRPFTINQGAAGGSVLFQNNKIIVPNNHLKDMYFFINFTVSYVFYKVKCPNPR